MLGMLTSTFPRGPGAGEGGFGAGKTAADSRELSPSTCHEEASGWTWSELELGEIPHSLLEISSSCSSSMDLTPAPPLCWEPWTRAMPGVGRGVVQAGA